MEEVYGEGYNSVVGKNLCWDQHLYLSYIP